MPAYNEAATISITLEKILEVDLIDNFQKEIVIVNDCSTDQTEQAINNFIASHA